MTSTISAFASPASNARSYSLAAEADAVSHRFAERLVLDRVSLSVHPCELFALLGPNGSGKSTLLRILATLIRPTQGVARICGFHVVDQKDEVRQNLGLVFQHPSLDQKLSIRENFRHQGHLYGLRGKELTRRTADLLGFFGLADRANDLVEKLSGGLRRRAEIAKSLLHQPPLLLLDEPSTGLDPAARLDFLAILRNLRDRHDAAAILTTHLIDEADHCDRVAILDQGRLLACDSPNALKARLRTDVVSIRTPDPASLAPQISGQFQCACTASGADLRIDCERGQELLPKIVEAFPGRIESITLSKPTLSDVYFQLTGRSLLGEAENERHA